MDLLATVGDENVRFDLPPGTARKRIGNAMNHFKMKAYAHELIAGSEGAVEEGLE
jgi:hypothetical protein